ncbi:hypothetical protein EJ04DRAFT_511008 [Polyplosphaeria fusca]|uniref:Uncharacterized protein n=1 Tax=Polyplosphaeria fusca TaxID=682080 RepID=A0A9P4V3C1_9PLEO|nr:hypothetical protein EJ04DRAFT_511008 [Polyplosphaeria fusca]
MHQSFFAKVLLLFTVFFTVGLAGPEMQVVRRQTGTPTDPTAPQCMDYSATANLSTIASNSTYRAAYMLLSPLGSMPNAKVLDAAKLKLPAMTMDQTLNAQCGNLTTVALQGAETNLTNNIVGPFTGVDTLPQGIYAGPAVVFIVSAVVIWFCLIWGFMP